MHNIEKHSQIRMEAKEEEQQQQQPKCVKCVGETVRERFDMLTGRWILKMTYIYWEHNQQTLTQVS